MEDSDKKALLEEHSARGAALCERKSRGETLSRPEARAERLYREALILDLFAANKSTEEIADIMGMTPWAVERLQESATTKALGEYTRLSPQAAFLQYATFHMRLIKRLDKACDLFMAEKSTQYNAYVSALKAESDIYDKVHTKGVEAGIITRGKVHEETKMKDRDLLSALLDEKNKLVELIGELEVSVEKRKVRVKVSKVADQGSDEKGPIASDSIVDVSSNTIDTGIVGDGDVSQNAPLPDSVEDGSRKREAIEVHEDDGE